MTALKFMTENTVVLPLANC